MKSKSIIKKVLLSIFALLVFPVITKAIENPEDLIKQIVPNGTSLTIKSFTPTTYEEAYEIINNIAYNGLTEEGYNAQGYCNPAKLTECQIEIQSDDFATEGMGEVVSGWHKVWNIAVTYSAPEMSAAAKNTIDYFLSNSDVDIFDETTYYIVEDMALINYYMTGEKSELWNPGAASRAIKFSSINNILYGANISFDISVGMGDYGEGKMYETAAGGMMIYYDGYIRAVTTGGVYTKRAIFIPSTTAENSDAYIAAAKKRIQEYLGTNDIEITLGGTLNSLDAEDLDPNIDVEDTDGNYYNVKIGNKTYKFYILKTAEIPVNPIYMAWNIDSRIEIASEDASIPLDTEIDVKDVTDENLKKIIYTDNYVSYDIKLYSSAKNANITYLPNGLFLVSIPVPKALEGKELVVYYINAQNEIIKYEVEVVDGYATFETDHFSTYTLATTPTKYTLSFSSNGGTVKNLQVPTELEGGDILKFGNTAPDEVEPPAGKEFDAYEVNGQRYEIGQEYTVTGETTIKLLWKDKKVETTEVDATPSVDTTEESISPKTGDSINTYISLLALGIIGFIATKVLKIKNQL